MVSSQLYKELGALGGGTETCADGEQSAASGCINLSGFHSV